jgi:hypothetical protein
LNDNGWPEEHTQQSRKRSWLAWEPIAKHGVRTVRPVEVLIAAPGYILAMSRGPRFVSKQWEIHGLLLSFSCENRVLCKLRCLGASGHLSGLILRCLGASRGARVPLQHC